MFCGNDSYRPSVLLYAEVARLLAWLLTLPPASSVLAPMVAYWVAVARLRLPPSAAARRGQLAARGRAAGAGGAPRSPPVASAAANGRPAAIAWAAPPTAWPAPKALPRPACVPV